MPVRTKVSSTKRSVDSSVVVLPFLFLACCFLFILALGHLFVFVVGEWRGWGVYSSLISWLQTLAKISVRLCSPHPLCYNMSYFVEFCVFS